MTISDKSGQVPMASDGLSTPDSVQLAHKSGAEKQDDVRPNSANGLDVRLDDRVDAKAGSPVCNSSPNHQDDSTSGNAKKTKKRRNRRRKRGGANVGHSQVSATVSQNEPGQTATPKVQLQKSQSASNANFRPQTAYAALDLGTNNCRLLVAVPTRPGNFRVIDAFSRIVRLGEGFGASGRLSDAAMSRSIEALKVCRDKLYSRPIQHSRLIATEACRSAENGLEFLERVKHETGLALEVVDRETEARLAVSGCSSLVDRSAKYVVLFDIGGGSSEIALVKTADYRGGRLADHISAWTSLPVGVVTMAEKFGGRDVSAQRFEEMISHATGLLNSHGGPELLASMAGGSASVMGNDFHLIGTSGTVTTLAGIHLELPRYDRRRVDGLWMSSQQVDKINAQLLDWSFEQRAANACIGHDRADLVLAGCAILEAIRKVWPSDRLRVADRGLREGLLTEMMATDGVWRRRNTNQTRYKHGQRNT